MTLTFNLHQGQSCCRTGDHNSPNLLVTDSYVKKKKTTHTQGYQKIMKIKTVILVKLGTVCFLSLSLTVIGGKSFQTGFLVTDL